MDDKLNTEEIEYDWDLDVELTTPPSLWSTIDFYTIIKDRKKTGITHENFDKDLKYWSNQLNRLSVQDYESITEELGNMDVTCPYDEHDARELEKKYSQLTGHMIRLNYLYNMIVSQVNLYECVYKAMKNIALSLSTGTAKDKESNAEFILQPYFRGILHAKKILLEIEGMKNSCEFSAMNLNRIVHLREAEYKMSSNIYNKEGQYFTFQDKTQNDNIDEPNRIIIRRKIYK